MVDWAKRNKIWLLVILLFLVFEIVRGTVRLPSPALLNSKTASVYSDMAQSSPAYGLAPEYSGGSGVSMPFYPPGRDAAPQAGVKNRLVVQDSNMSLLVRNVEDVRNKILGYTESKGGYMVTSSTSNPQDAPTSVITVRVPANSLKDTLEYFRSLSVKVVSENLIGRDVTDEYVDVEAQIAQLTATKERLEEILDKAIEIEDITNLTQQILSYQNQIDSLKGQTMSLEKNAQLAKMTIFLSTDEIALPYAPSETFRPQVIFKLAVRSLVGTLRNLAGDIIWIAVYSVIWLPVLGIILLIKKWLKDRQDSNSSGKIK